LVFGSNYLLLLKIDCKMMSSEVFEISVMLDEHFDVNFDLTKGFLGFILKVFGS
jgi:hypothetical protein